MYRVFGVTSLFALALSGCTMHDMRDDGGFAEEPVPVVDSGDQTQLAALPPIPARRPADMSGIIPPESAYLAEKKIDDLVGLSLEETENLLGGPALEEVQPPAKIWSYNGRDCVLSIFFYPRVGGEDFRALAYQVTGPAAAVADEAAAATPEAQTAAAASGTARVSEADRRCFTTLVAQNASARKMAADKAAKAGAEAPSVE